ncbi:MAG: GNAT family N-acetyltransferase, partial [Planctomycetota bacterium]
RLTDIRDDEALAVGSLLAAVWPKPDRGPVERAVQVKAIGKDYDGPEALAPISYLVHDGDLVIGHSLTFAREIATVEGPLTVMALAMVATDPDRRGQGLGAAVVEAAFERAIADDFAACLYQTSFKVEPFYERLGACRVTNRIVNSLSKDDPESNPFWDEVVMRYPATAAWPDGEIDLRGKGY